MAQLVAHLHGMQGVRGSSPLRSTHDRFIEPESISRYLILEVKPEFIFILLALTPNSLAKSFITPSFAAPSTGLAFILITYVPSRAISRLSGPRDPGLT